MDTGLHVDFCFSCPGGIIVAAGWSPLARLPLTLRAGALDIPPDHLLRFARRDLRSLAPQGFIAVFDLSLHPGARDDPSEELGLAMGGEDARMDGALLVADARSLVEIGVDETFYALLRLIATGAVPLPDKVLMPRMVRRIRAGKVLPPECEFHALTMDRGLLGPGGQGIATGWFLGTAGMDERLAALVIDDRQLARVTLLQGVLARPDLAGYAGRYSYGGHDGWAAGFRLPDPPTGAVRLVLLAPGQMEGAGLVGGLRQSGADDVARALLETRAALDNASPADRLHRAMAQAPTRLPATEAVPAPRPDAPMRLVLDHDLGPADLRDVLRRAADAGRAIRLHLLRPAMTPALACAIAGAEREVALPLTLAGCAMSPPQDVEEGELLVFARSSVLFHLADLIPAAGRAATPGLHVRMLDPAASLPGTAASDLPARLALQRPPFLCWGDAGALLPPLAVLAHGVLSVESAFRDLALLLGSRGKADLAAARAAHFHVGTQGPCAAPLLDAITPHDFDALTARLLREAA